jgi:hypothetical protein
MNADSTPNEATVPAPAPAAPQPPATQSWPPPAQPSRLYRAYRRLRQGRHRRALGPGMALYLVSPIVAELCLGSTPIISYIFFGWMLCLMYGGGAILIREAAFRWGKGWPTILTLGVAYAIAEEGIAVRTFFDPTAPALKGLVGYGWLGGANWVWITHLSLYHAIVSISIPIFLVTLAYPARRNESWVGDRWLKKAAVGYVAVILFWLVIYQRPVNGALIVGSFAAIAALVAIARRLPATFRLPARLDPNPGAGTAPTPRRVVIVAFAATCAVFIIVWGRGFGAAPLVTMAEILAVSGVTGWWFIRGSTRPGWTDRQRYAVAAGIFFFLPVLSPIIELTGGRFQSIVGLVTAWLIVRQWRRLREREGQTSATPVAVPLRAGAGRSAVLPIE